MSNQTFRKPIEDPEIKRCRYLKQQRGKYFAWFAGIAALLSFLVCGATTILLVRNIIVPEPSETARILGYGGDEERENYILRCLGLMSIIAVSGLIALRAGIWANERIVDLEDVPYVPTVAEQIAALPAEEVLLRSSDQPIPLPEELLRPAHAGAGDMAEELLRAESRTA
jgi:hypothetical protein